MSQATTTAVTNILKIYIYNIIDLPKENKNKITIGLVEM